MSLRLGIWVGRTELRAVVARGGRVVWRSRALFASPDRLDQAFNQLLANAPHGTLRRPRAGVAIGLAHSQVRQIEGLPPTNNLPVLTRMVRENADSFFLRFGGRLVVTGVERRADGGVWAAAFDGALVDAVVVSLRRCGFRRVTIASSIVALSVVAAHGLQALVEDGIACEVTTDARTCLTRVRRVLSTTAAPNVPSALASLGDDASDFVAAYCAASVSPTSPFVWRAGPNRASDRTVERFRVATAVAFLVIAIVGALTAPGVRATLSKRNASRELDAMRGAEIEMARADAELRRVSAKIDRIEEFQSARGRVALLLGALAQSLPESTALVSLRIDTLDASFVAVTTHAADVLPQLVSVDDVVSPRIVGSISREMVGGAHIERATFRFRRRRSTANAKRQ